MRKLSLILATFAFANIASANNVVFTAEWNPDSKTFTVKDGTNTKGEKMNDEQKKTMEKYLSAAKDAIEKDKEGAATLGLFSTISGLLGGL
jgi:hypothetical protein